MGNSTSNPLNTSCFFLVSVVSLILFRNLWLRNPPGSHFHSKRSALISQIVPASFSSHRVEAFPTAGIPSLIACCHRLEPSSSPSPSTSLVVSAERGGRIVMIKAEAETFCNQNSSPLSAGGETRGLSRSSLAGAGRCHFPVIVSDSFLHL